MNYTLNFHHLSFILASTFLTCSCLLSSASAKEPKPPRPNIIFFYADDLGYGDLACYGSEVAQTPHLDRLARGGTRFTQFYVSHCVCSPTRCSAITGHYPSRHRIYAHIAYLHSNRERGMPDWLDRDAPSLPRALQKAGYRTAMIGKWHLGGGSGRTFRGKPINHPGAPDVVSYGFDYARTTFGNSPTWKNAKPAPKPHDIYPYEDQGWLRWSSEAIADDAIAFLEDHAKTRADQPFMVNVWFKDPHVPFRPTEEMLQPFNDLEEPARTHYAMIHFMDEQIGRVLNKLDSLGLAKNTLVIFSSDNGAGKNRGGSCGPLREWKWYLYEGGIRVPLIVRWPERVSAGKVNEKSVLNIVDFIPTFCRLTGASMPNNYQPDGVDITDALFGKPFSRRQSMFWHHPTAGKRSPTLAIRDGDWKLLMDPDGERLELYNLVEDIGESNNLTEDRDEMVQALKKKLLAWYEQLPKP